MQYNGETNQQDIVSMSRTLAGNASASGFKIEDITRFSNQAMRHIWSWIFLVFGGWIYDDNNQTDLPEATTALVANQSLYTFPTDSAHISALEWKDQAGNWNRIDPITLEQILEVSAEGEYENTPGNPIRYRLSGNTVKLYPASNFSQAASLKVFFSRDVVEFDVADTTEKPGFVSEFHAAIPTFNALQFAKIKTLKNRIDLQKDWDGNEDVTGREGGYKAAIKRFYSMRFKQMFPAKMRNDTDVLQEYT